MISYLSSFEGKPALSLGFLVALWGDLPVPRAPLAKPLLAPLRPPLLPLGVFAAGDGCIGLYGLSAGKRFLTLAGSFTNGTTTVFSTGFWTGFSTDLTTGCFTIGFTTGFSTGSSIGSSNGSSMGSSTGSDSCVVSTSASASSVGCQVINN